MEHLDVTECEYHRNGVCGIGFYTLIFSYTESGTKSYALATVSGDDFQEYLSKGRKDRDVNHQTRILLFGRTGGVDIHNTMRGDWYHDDLCEWLKRNPTKRTTYKK